MLYITMLNCTILNFKCCTLQCCTVQYKTVQCFTVHCCTVQKPGPGSVLWSYLKPLAGVRSIERPQHRLKAAKGVLRSRLPSPASGPSTALSAMSDWPSSGAVLRALFPTIRPSPRARRGYCNSLPYQKLTLCQISRQLANKI